VWAYVGQHRLEHFITDYGDKTEIHQHFCSVFPDTWSKIEANWKERGGFEGYGRHVQEVVSKFEGMTVHPDVWAKVRPRSSASPHLFVKAVEIVARAGGEDPKTTPYEAQTAVIAAATLRRAFFERALDIASWEIQRDIATEIGMDFADVQAVIESGEAIALLAGDYETAQKKGIAGSPTYVLNEGRQKLYGNVSARVLEANVKELLLDETGDRASRCL
jgi:predicted DsbA family dithiol-disulfide isomerase